MLLNSILAFAEEQALTTVNVPTADYAATANRSESIRRA